MRLRVQEVLRLSWLVLLFIVAISAYIVIWVSDPFIEPGGMYRAWTIPMTITNQTSRAIEMDTSAMASVIKVNGAGECLSFIIDGSRTDVGVVIDGKIHINGQNELAMNAGVLATCYTSRFVLSHVNEGQLYDAVTLGTAQAVRLSAGTYEDFVTLMGGKTYLPEDSFNSLFLPSGLPLHFQP